MNKSEILSILKQSIYDLSALVENISNSPSLEIAGSLVSRNQHGKKRLFKRLTGSEDQYLFDRKTIRLLATKAYALKLDKAAKLESKQIERCIRILESDKNKDGVDIADIDSVFGRLPEYVRSNTTPSIATDDGYADSWQRESYNSRWKKDTDVIYETPRGEKVRSKSEWIIASMLHEAGVPYRYEEIVPLNAEVGVFLHPDFTVLNKRTRKVYYWEHFGKMGDPEYIENSFMPKINDYYNFGFLPGDRLLMTFESKGSPLDTTQVKRLIERFLL